MKKIKDFCVENKMLVIASICIIALSMGIYYYNHKQESKIYEKGESEDIEYVKREYQENEYSPITVELVDLLNEYYSHFINLQINNPDAAYELLTESTKKDFDNDIEKYKKYIKENSTALTINNKVEKYHISGYDKQQFNIVDSEKYKYTIYENAIWDFKISIDGRE